MYKKVGLMLCALMLFATMAVAEEARVECEAGVCKRWIVRETIDEINVVSEISKADGELTFLGNLPSLNLRQAESLYSILNKMLSKGISFDAARQMKVDYLTERKTVLENKTTDK